VETWVPAEVLLRTPNSLLTRDWGNCHSSAFYYRIANEKLGNKLREQVKYIAKLTGEKE
jgi:hypothetical protein